MRATQIKREGSELIVTWDDGEISHYPIEYLRSECPCAECKGEIMFGKVYAAPKLTLFKPGMNELAALMPVGSYGIQAAWKDGHDTGIYSWEYLRSIAPEKAAKDNLES